MPGPDGIAVARHIRALHPDIPVLFISGRPDLLRSITIPVEVDFLAISSYTPDQEQGVVRLVKDLEAPVTGRDVLFVEDVIDTGLTLNYLLRTLRTRKPASLEVCTLLNKPSRRKTSLPCRYTGFSIPNAFVIGYGLDYAEHGRNLSFIAELDEADREC